jgi:hypothetical protein
VAWAWRQWRPVRGSTHGQRRPARAVHQGPHPAHHLLLFYSRLTLAVLARDVFEEMPCPNIFSYNALLVLAAHARDPRRAAEIFARVPDPDVISYNTLLASFRLATDALQLFITMSPDGFTVSSAVSSVTTVAVAAQLHAFAVISGIDA